MDGHKTINPLKNLLNHEALEIDIKIKLVMRLMQDIKFKQASEDENIQTSPRIK